jgi:putative transposase
LKVKVHAANIMDRDGACLVLRGVKKQYPSIQHLWQDAAYNGKHLNEYIEAKGWTVQTIKRSRSRLCIVEEQYLVKVDRSKFEVLPRR